MLFVELLKLHEHDAESSKQKQTVLSRSNTVTRRPQPVNDTKAFTETLARNIRLANVHHSSGSQTIPKNTPTKVVNVGFQSGGVKCSTPKRITSTAGAKPVTVQKDHNFQVIF